MTMSRRWRVVAVCSLVLASVAIAFDSSDAAVHSRTGKLEWLCISADGHGFAGAKSGTKFVPLGFNYDRDYKSRLIEEYWDAEWKTVEEDFGEMKELGANVVRVHLQFAKFMDTASKPNRAALRKLGQLVKLAEKTGLYLDLTGLACYRKKDVPAWYDSLSQKERWAAQACFWEAIARTCAHSPAIFCYDLMNEPVVPAQPGGEWLVGQLAGFYYVQAITRDPAGRDRAQVAQEWISTLSKGIRRHDDRHLITVGLLPDSADDPSSSGFIPSKVADKLDYISVHIYPNSHQLPKDFETLKKFCVGKPVVMEEMFPLACTAQELKQFVEKSQGYAAGWIGFYWGQTIADLEKANDFGAVAFMIPWLKTFQELRSSVGAGQTMR